MPWSRRSPLFATWATSSSSPSGASWLPALHCRLGPACRQRGPGTEPAASGRSRNGQAGRAAGLAGRRADATAGAGGRVSSIAAASWPAICPCMAQYARVLARDNRALEALPQFKQAAWSWSLPSQHTDYAHRPRCTWNCVNPQEALAQRRTPTWPLCSADQPRTRDLRVQRPDAQGSGADAAVAQWSPAAADRAGCQMPELAQRDAERGLFRRASIEAQSRSTACNARERLRELAARYAANSASAGSDAGSAAAARRRSMAARLRVARTGAEGRPH